MDHHELVTLLTTAVGGFCGGAGFATAAALFHLVIGSPKK